MDLWEMAGYWHLFAILFVFYVMPTPLIVTAGSLCVVAYITREVFHEVNPFDFII